MKEGDGVVAGGREGGGGEGGGGGRGRYQKNFFVLTGHDC